MRLRGGSLAASLFPRTLTQWLGPVLAIGLVAGALGVLVLASGLMDLRASTPHPEGWAELLHAVFRRATDHQSRNVKPPAEIGSPRMIAKGAVYYGRACAHCHGGARLGQNPVALSMTPRPQYLYNEAKTFDDRALFWIVKHGVKYSAMPAWPAQDRDDEVWSIVAFLRAMSKMTALQFQKIVYGPLAASPARAVGVLAPDESVRHLYALPHSDVPPDPTYAYNAPAIGFDDTSVGRSPVASCVLCHGADGAGRAAGAFPNIALLDRTYFRDALIDYARGERHSGFMQTVAVQLSDAQIEQLADYYASLPKRQSQAVSVPTDVMALGARIATSGIARSNVAACGDCHGISKASAKAFSALDGQYPAYLRDQLRLYRQGVRGREPRDPMRNVAKGMTDGEIDAVALFYGSRPPWAGRIVAKPAGAQ